ncbi:hypothetical protein CCP4SC76_5880007 [Gammaproteobacteria bacterium]
MIDDSIVEEVRKHRQEHAARFNYDLAAIFADLIEREKNSSRPVICRSPRRIGAGNELEKINPCAEELNREAEDVIAYQVLN